MIIGIATPTIFAKKLKGRAHKVELKQVRAEDAERILVAESACNKTVTCELITGWSGTPAQHCILEFPQYARRSAHGLIDRHLENTRSGASWWRACSYIVGLVIRSAAERAIRVDRSDVR
jgi:hypothetical protein